MEETHSMSLDGFVKEYEVKNCFSPFCYLEEEPGAEDNADTKVRTENQ